VALVTTVADKKSKYTADEYSRALLARKLQVTIGRPSLRQYLDIVTRGILPNCPVTRADVLAAEDIFGPDVGILKGKTMRRTPPPVRLNMTAIPPEILMRCNNLIIAADVMYVNKIPFLVSIFHGLRFGTCKVLDGMSAKHLLMAIKKIKQVYAQRGLTIAFLKMDGQFEPCRMGITELGMGLNTTARDEHVAEAERFIRTIKERMRCIWNTLPFNKIPKRLVIEMAYSCVFWLNAFPSANGVSPDLSPRSIVIGTPIDYARHCQLEFGAYAVEIHAPVHLSSVLDSLYLSTSEL
jgi:hypothetical protein